MLAAMYIGLLLQSLGQELSLDTQIINDPATYKHERVELLYGYLPTMNPPYTRGEHVWNDGYFG